jgi:hypothetical protein
VSGDERQRSAASAISGVATLTISGAFTYDGDSRVASSTANFNGLSFTLTAGYDSMSNRTSLADSQGRSITATFDAAGRQTGESMVGNSVQCPQVTLGYDRASRLTSLTRGHGLKVDSETIRRALERIKLRAVLDWCWRKLGMSVLSQHGRACGQKMLANATETG